MRSTNINPKSVTPPREGKRCGRVNKGIGPSWEGRKRESLGKPKKGRTLTICTVVTLGVVLRDFSKGGREDEGREERVPLRKGDRGAERPPGKKMEVSLDE